MVYAFALLRPMDMTLPIWPCARRFIQTMNPMNKMIGSSKGIRLVNQFDSGVVGLKSTPFSSISLRSSSFGKPTGAVVLNLSPLVN
ncbi:unannotated protein [freshwater metagenome]|uniref:Unannotated protein n=1 Tax=freshwater metagenome TaxID=449393 RepID=A0A6J7E9U6_9ZZZZ